jgi:hypothetical protein
MDGDCQQDPLDNRWTLPYNFDRLPNNLVDNLFANLFKGGGKANDPGSGVGRAETGTKSDAVQ